METRGRDREDRRGAMMADTRRIEDDPIAVQILWERCISIVDEAADKLVRAAFSTVARESNDFGCVLCDADGVGVGYTTRGTGPRRFAAGSARPDRNGDHGVIDGHVPPL